MVVCEKPDAAKKISEALSGGKAQRFMVEGVTVHKFAKDGENYVVASVQGHVYGLSDPFKERSVYPSFDTEWYPLNLVEKSTRARAARRLEVVNRLARFAAKFVNACDYDVEGETIGFNVLRYARPGSEHSALRAKFSTLTTEELNVAFGRLDKGGAGLARAGRARHLIDFAWGVNMSRMLTRSVNERTKRYRTISVGRVQGPTLSFLTSREREIREFVPVPYWKVHGRFGGENGEFDAECGGRFLVKAEALRVLDDCVGRESTAVRSASVAVSVMPPPPLNTGDLQKEAYRAFGFSPSKTLMAAERLYLSGLISYPRTASQKLPPTIGYNSILRRLAESGRRFEDASEILRSESKPVQGLKEDYAHPAIYPTAGRHPSGTLDAGEDALYDIIVRRFMAAFGPPARQEVLKVDFEVEGHTFRLQGKRTVFLGWMKYYGKYSARRDDVLPKISVGEKLKVLDLKVTERFEEPPPRFSESTLLEKMENESIGTKSTRAGVISTLIRRGYVGGTRLTVTDLGLSVAELIQESAPMLASAELTAVIEKSLDEVEEGKASDVPIVRDALKSIADQLVRFEEDERRDVPLVVGDVSAPPGVTLGKCPICKSGELRIVKSGRTGKRFVGCSAYGSGCRASAPLPQRGTVRPFGACQECSWPVVRVMLGRRPWSLCVNPACPAKGRKKIGL